MSLSTELTVAIITGAIAVLVSAAAFIYGWVNVGPLRGIIDELRADIVERKKREVLFEAKNTRYLKRIAYLTEGIRVLLEQIRRHREAPCWTPEDWDPNEEEHDAAMEIKKRPRKQIEKD